MRCPVTFFNYSIQNATEDSVDIYIDGDIVDASTQKLYEEWFGDDTTTSYKSFRNKLEAVDAKTYNVYINSGGGMVTDAMAIHDLLIDMQNKGKTVNTIGRGIIASAATYILMAGKSPRMSKNSWFMIHNVSGYAWGDVDQIERFYNVLRKFNNRSRDFYAEATGISKDDITQMMKDETWLTADEAKQKGFIGVVDGEAEFTNSISSEKWAFSNQAVLNAYNSCVRTAPPEPNNIHQQFKDDMKKFFQQLATDILNAVKGVKKPEDGSHEQLMESIGTVVSNVMASAGEKFDEELNTATTQAATTMLDLSKDGPFKQSLMAMITSAVAEHANLANNEGLRTSVENAVDAKIKNLATKEDLTNLETAVQTDITEIKGSKSNSGQNQPKQEAPIGAWQE